MNPEEEAKKLAEKYGVTFKPGELEKYAEERRIRQENAERKAKERESELLRQPRLESQNEKQVSSGVRGPARGARVIAALLSGFGKEGGKRSKKSKRRISRRNRNKRRTRRH